MVTYQSTTRFQRKVMIINSKASGSPAMPNLPVWLTLGNSKAGRKLHPSLALHKHTIAGWAIICLCTLASLDAALSISIHNDKRWLFSSLGASIMGKILIVVVVAAEQTRQRNVVMALISKPTFIFLGRSVLGKRALPSDQAQQTVRMACLPS